MWFYLLIFSIICFFLYTYNPSDLIQESFTVYWTAIIYNLQYSYILDKLTSCIQINHKVETVKSVGLELRSETSLHSLSQWLYKL